MLGRLRSQRIRRRGLLWQADALELGDHLAKVTASLGKPLRLRVELSSFDAVCRMVGAGVGIGVVPEMSAQRNLAEMHLAQVELTDPWRIRERFVLVREGEVLPAYAQALIDALLAFYRARPAKGAAPGAAAVPARRARSTR